MKKSQQVLVASIASWANHWSVELRKFAPGNLHRPRRIHVRRR
jgi:hypothetical protein